MLTSVSGFQSGIQGRDSSQHSFAYKNNQTEDLKKTSTDNTLKSESSKLQQKALEELSKAEQATVQKLKNRDNEVKAHEQAHLSAAGGIATGGASFSYTSGPDGVRYATGGEVSIDTSPVHGDPAATLRKADIIRRAALAPASPSAQDQSVANSASTMASKARAELIQQEQETPTADKNKKTEDNNDQSSNNQISNDASAITGALIDIAV
ncbi:MAG: SprA-related family protein [Methylomarinum sp.]|nr:SprA-related family protein [Methylomarinum sp.]